MAQDRDVEFLSLTSYIDFLCGAFAAVVLLFVVLLPSGSSTAKVSDPRSYWEGEVALKAPVSLEDLVVEVGSENNGGGQSQLASWSPLGGCYCMTHSDPVDSKRQDMSVEIRPAFESNNESSLSRIKVRVSVDSLSVNQARLRIELHGSNTGSNAVKNTLFPFRRRDFSAR